MDPDLLKSFNRQIWTQCEFAFIAYDDLALQIADAAVALEWARSRDSEIAGLPLDQMLVRAREIAMHWSVRTWQPIQAFMTSAANIAVALWGQNGKRSVERAPLRRALDVDDSSPLHPISSLNNFAHFDERLEHWWESSPTHDFVDLEFDDAGSVSHGRLEHEIFRSYDPASGELVFWGQWYNLRSIMTEIERIAPRELGSCLARASGLNRRPRRVGSWSQFQRPVNMRPHASAVAVIQM